LLLFWLLLGLPIGLYLKLSHPCMCRSGLAGLLLLLLHLLVILPLLS
jgi:hypothetical protein